jgi:hypothetical protein
MTVCAFDRDFVVFTMLVGHFSMLPVCAFAFLSIVCMCDHERIVVHQRRQRCCIHRAHVSTHHISLLTDVWYSVLYYCANYDTNRVWQYGWCAAVLTW